MALRSSYYGLKKKLLEKVKALPAIKSIGDGLSLDSSTGELTATGGGGTTVVANPEGTATADLTKLKVGDTIYGVEADTSACYQTTDDTESAIVDADYIPFFDASAASGEGAPKKSTWSNFCSKIAAKLSTVFNEYLGISSIGSGLGIDNGVLSVTASGTGEPWVKINSGVTPGAGVTITGYEIYRQKIDNTHDMLHIQLDANVTGATSTDIFKLEGYNDALREEISGAVTRIIMWARDTSDQDSIIGGYISDESSPSYMMDFSSNELAGKKKVMVNTNLIVIKNS